MNYLLSFCSFPYESLKALHSENPWTGGYGDCAYYTPTFAFQDGLNWQYWALINNVLHTTRCLNEREGCDCLTTKVISICFMFKTKLHFRERNHQYQRYTCGVRFCISRLGIQKISPILYLFKLGIQSTVLLIRYLFRHYTN